MQKTNIDKPTPEDIAGWKEKYGAEKVFEITSDDKTKVCYLRKPGRLDLDYAAKAGEQGAFKFNEALMKQCWLGGDEEMITDDDYFLDNCNLLGEFVKRGQATLKKL